MKSFAAILLVLAFALSFAWSGESHRPNVWSGPWPSLETGGCPQYWQPVHDAQGNVYPNPCEAAMLHVRVTWDVE